jgi:peptidoglycan-associated lipoprotein
MSKVQELTREQLLGLIIGGLIVVGLILWWWQPWAPKQPGPKEPGPPSSSTQTGDGATNPPPAVCAHEAPPIRLRVNVVIRSMQGLKQSGIPEDLAQHVDEITKVFRPAGIELSISNRSPTLDYLGDVSDEQIDKLFAANATAAGDPTVTLLILSKWQQHLDTAGELWSKRDRNQIAIFADAILSSHDEDKLRSIRRTIAHELVHAFGLHHMDWEGESASEASSIEGYSRLSSALWCLSGGSAEYLATAPLPFVTPGTAAVPFSIVSYMHSGHFHADPRDPVDMVVAVPDDSTPPQIIKYRYGLLPAAATVANLNKKSANKGELVAFLRPDAPSFEQTQDINLTLTMQNHGKTPWYVPAQDDLEKPDTLRGGADNKLLWLVSTVSELKGVNAIAAGGELSYHVRMNSIAGYHGPEAGTQLDNESYAVNLVVPVAAKIGEPAVEFITASTVIQMKAAASPLGSTLWSDLDQRFGSRGRWCFNNFLRFGGCVGDEGMPKYLDDLLQQGLVGPQRSAVCRALLQNAERKRGAESAQQRAKERWASCSIESAATATQKEDVRATVTHESGVDGSPKSSAASPSWVPHLMSDVVDKFAPGSSVIPDAGLDAISAEVEVLNSHPTAGILLIGRADSAGSHESNCLIGHRRAAAVRISLRLLGLSDDRIHLVSRGDLDPDKHGSKDPDPDGHARRVDLRYLSTNPPDVDNPLDCDLVLRAAAIALVGH